MDPVVSVEWLAQRLHQPSLVVLDATLPPPGAAPVAAARDRYHDRHIPGAVFFDIEALSDRHTTLPHMLPSPSDFASSMSALGVGSDMQIVVYEEGGVFSAPRARWMLQVMGASAVFLLDGGLRAWANAGLPLEFGNATLKPAVFYAYRDTNAVCDFAQVQELLRTGGQIVDARPAPRFHGDAPEPRPGIRSGHMPGAVNLPSAELATAEGNYKSAAQMRALLQARGLDLNRPVATTCGSGITAAVLALALERAGAARVSLYDGSWAEYAQQPDARIEPSAATA